MTAPTLTTRDLGDLSPSTAYRLAASGRLNPADPAITSILTAMDTDPASVSLIRDHAERAGMPYSTFRVAFREATGMSWQRYLVDARMRLARALLQSTARSVQAIGWRVGYQTKEAFSTAFHTEHGMWPTQYREQVRS